MASADPGGSQEDVFWASLLQDYLGSPDPRQAIDPIEEAGPAAHPDHGEARAEDAGCPQVSQEIVQQLARARPEKWAQTLLGGLFEDIVALLGRLRGQPAVDGTVQKLGAFYLEQPRALHATKAAIGHLLQVNPKKIEPALRSLGSALLHTDRAARHQVEQQIAQSGAHLLLYLDLNRFDETPMKVSQRQPLDSVVQAALGQPAATEEGVQQSFLRRNEARAQPMARGAATAKLFASEQRFGMLLKLSPDQVQEGQSPYLFLQGLALTSLQVLEKATGMVMKDALLANNSVSSEACKFNYKVRLSTTDMAPANALAERSIVADRDGAWSHLHLPCNVHIISRIFQKVFSFADADVSGMINFSLSLSLGPPMERFRKTLATVVSEKLVVIPGTCPRGAEEYRHFVLQLFGSTGSNLALKQFLLRNLPNGDWRESARVEVYVEPGIAYDEGRLREEVTSALLLSLVGKNFSTYPRHRWLGCDISTDEFGLCEAVHGLASSTYHRMLSSSATPMHQPPTCLQAAAQSRHQHWSSWRGQPPAAQAEFLEPSFLGSQQLRQQRTMLATVAPAPQFLGWTMQPISWLQRMKDAAGKHSSG